MEIDIKFLRDMSHALEMNGRQFILRDKKIQEMKSTETYEVPHGNDLIYYHIKSDILKSIIDSIFIYISTKDDGEGMEVAMRSTIEHQYASLTDLGSHDDFMKAMDKKYSIKF